MKKEENDLLLDFMSIFGSSKNFMNFDPIFDKDDSWKSTVTTTGMTKYNIYKKDNKYVYDIDVAGFSKDQIELNEMDDYLLIHAMRDEYEKDKFIVSERLPTEINLKINVKIKNFNVKAKLENGILRVELEKKEEKTRKIKIE
ncbi:MAG: Hsp20/alpha crystallin family protein [bacterium]